MTAYQSRNGLIFDQVNWRNRASLTENNSEFWHFESQSILNGVTEVQRPYIYQKEINAMLPGRVAYTPILPYMRCSVQSHC